LSLPGRPARRLVLAPLFLVSLSALGYEIALTRYFAVAEWSDYGYWVISIVMAGFAFSGVALALARDKAVRHGEALLAALPPLLVLAAGLGFHLTAENPFNPLQLQNPVTWAPQLWNIAGYYAALLPFFFLAGLFIGLSFVLNAERIGAVYAWDLTGAGAGAAVVMVLMFLLHPFRLVPVLLVPLAASAVFIAGTRRVGAQHPIMPAKAWTESGHQMPRVGAMDSWLRRNDDAPMPQASRRRWMCIAATGTALIAMEALLLFGSQPRINDFKPIYPPLHTPGAKVVAERNTPGGAYLLLDDFTERVNTDISNDAGMLGLPGPPRSLGLYRDGERIAALPKGTGLPDVGYAKASLDALPYALVPGARVLLAGASGGFRVAEALRLGARQVVALEPEPVLYGALRDGLGPSPPLAMDRRVSLLNEGPLAAARPDAHYGIVDLSADFLDAAPANATAFTVEAIVADLRALAPNGIVSLPVSIRDFPVYALRLLATARSALLAAGVNDPATHIVIYRSAWNARLLLSNGRWDAGRIAAIRRFCDQRSFDVSYYPGIDVAASRSGIYNDLPAISFASGEVSAGSPDDSIADEAAAVLAGQQSPSGVAFNLAPMTLDRPFFYAVLRLSQLGLLLQRLEVLPQAEIGALVNLAVLAQAVVIALLVLSVPLIAPGRMRPERGGLLRTMLYFPALGLGFLFVEIFLIEQASLWLNDRASGFALVLTGMLVCSGIGSAMSGRFAGNARQGIALATLVMAGWSAVVLTGLQPVILATLGEPWVVRAALVLAVAAPVSFALGLPFPLGLSRLGSGGALPWAWGLNGAFSVVATPLANLIAREAGYRLLLLCAAGLYIVALAAFPVVRRRIQWLHFSARSHAAD